MTKETLLMQYQSECRSALKSVVNIRKPFENDAVLYYPTLERKTGKRGHPKWFDGKIDFTNLDLTRCTEYKVNKGKLYELGVYAKALKRYVSLSIWYPMDGRTDKWYLYFSTDDSNASLTAVNLVKAACKRQGMTYSISSCKTIIYNASMLERFICVSGINPDPQVIDKLFKELILFTTKAV